MSQAWRTGAPTGGPGYAPPPGYGGAPVAQSGMPQGGMPMAQGGMPQGGSFLGTAAAAATGAIGGSLLMNGIRNLMGGHQGGTAHAAADPSGGINQLYFVLSHGFQGFGSSGSRGSGESISMSSNWKTVLSSLFCGKTYFARSSAECENGASPTVNMS